MRTVVCAGCNEPAPIPDNLLRAHCVHCGQPIDLAETRVTSDPMASPVQVTRGHPIEDYAKEKPVRRSNRAYANWDEFRTMSPAVAEQLAHLATRPLPDLRHVDCDDPPKNAPSAEDLGELVGTFTKFGENRLAHIVIGCCVLLVACAVAVFPILELFQIFDNRMGRRPEDFGVTLMAFPVAFVAAWYTFLREPWYTVTFWVYERGVLCERGPEFVLRRWEDIYDLQVKMETGDPVYYFTVREGFRVVLSSNSGPIVELMMEYVEMMCTSARFLPALQTIYENGRVKFGLLAMDRAGLSGPRFYAHWSEIVEIQVDLTNFIVIQKGKGAQAIVYYNVSFPSLAISIAQVFIAEERR